MLNEQSPFSFLLSSDSEQYRLLGMLYSTRLKSRPSKAPWLNHDSVSGLLLMT